MLNNYKFTNHEKNEIYIRHFKPGFSINYFFVSCNNEDETTATTQFQDSEVSTQERRNSESEATIKLNNKTYQFYNDIIDLYENNEFSYSFEVAELDYTVSEFNTNSLRITNSLNTNEFIEITNLIEDEDGTITFDLKFDNLIITVIEFKNNSNHQNKGGGIWGPIIKYIGPVVLDMILDMKDGDEATLTNCRKAFRNMKCSEGKNPYMKYSAGSLWSKASCEVGCK